MARCLSLCVLYVFLELASSALSGASDDGPIWDFIVVGAGTGGALCAARLAEYTPGGATVLLLEAGMWDDPSHYAAGPSTRGDRIWEYPSRLPPRVTIHSHNRKAYAGGKGLGGSSQVHGDVYNRQPLREWEYLGYPEWSEQRVRDAYTKIEADMHLSWLGDNSLDDVPDPQYMVLEKMISKLPVRYYIPKYKSGPAMTDPAGGGAATGWWFYRTCTGDGADRKCRRHTSYSDLVAGRNGSTNAVETLPDSLVTRVLFDDDEQEAVGVEVLRHGRRHEAYASRAVILAAGALGTPKILMLSGIGDPYELQRLGIDVRVANREVGQGLEDHLATGTWFMMSADKETMLDQWAKGPECEDKERFNVFFNISGQQGGDGPVEAELRFLTGCNLTREPMPTVDFFIESVLLHPESRGRVVLTSPNPQALPTIEFPPIWEKDFTRLEQLLTRVAEAMELQPDDMAASSGFSLHESVRRDSYLYQHMCCSSRAAPLGQPGVCDMDLRVRGVGGLYVADASGLPTLPSAHTSSAVLLAAELAARHAAFHAPLRRTLKTFQDGSAHHGRAALFSNEVQEAAAARIPTVEIPYYQHKDMQVGNETAADVLGGGRSSRAGSTTVSQIALGTGTIAEQRVAGAVTDFLREGGRHLDLAQMYDNYASVRAGMEASGLGQAEHVALSWKVMPLGAAHIQQAVAEALKELKRERLDVAMLHWPGDISTGKLLRGAPLPPCATRLPEGNVSWMRCRLDSYMALMKERDAGRVGAVGVSNFAVKHLDDLQQAGLPAPAIHQLEMHPFWIDVAVLERSAQDGTPVMAYGCLGGAHTGATLLRGIGFKKIAQAASERAKRTVTPAQVLLRWGVQQGAVVVTGGSSEAHIKQNLQIFDFDLIVPEMEFMGSPGELVKSYGPHPEEIL
eukprot:TRINITY_DN13440_c0_g1_i1.p1 TRINITY_DN13440_c0_g1~~TRINITY_DN13440_c0_g1_i1.p1  ORF type:complete len:908 (-),score=176.21 TRINITY_DN13440_c0_g1_i1:470-3193(-)